MNKIYGYDTNIYETSIRNIKKDESYITTDEMTYSMLVQKIDQLQSNWNSLREYCEENKYFYSGYQREDREEDLSIKGVLDKMNELEGKDKE